LFKLSLITAISDFQESASPVRSFERICTKKAIGSVPIAFPIAFRSAVPLVSMFVRNFEKQDNKGKTYAPVQYQLDLIAKSIFDFKSVDHTLKYLQ